MKADLTPICCPTLVLASLKNWAERLIFSLSADDTPWIEFCLGAMKKKSVKISFEWDFMLLYKVVSYWFKIPFEELCKYVPT